MPVYGGQSITFPENPTGQVLSDYGTWVNSGGASVWGAITGNLADQDDLADILDGKASVTHYHEIGDVSGLQTVLEGKSSVGHGHAISDTTGLQTSLDAKQITLVSGTNIKTIGGNTILGSGDVPVGGGQTYFFLIDI